MFSLKYLSSLFILCELLNKYFTSNNIQEEMISKYHLLQSSEFIFNIYKLIYKIEPGPNNIQFFLYNFIENNKDKCIILIDNNIYQINSYINYKKN